MTTGISAYQDHSISTQPQGRVVVLLYEGAVKFLKQALVELDAGHWGEKGRYINKALAIVDQLDLCLDVEAGGEIAMNLRRLYDFMRRRLFEANLERSSQKLNEVIGILAELHEGWKAIAG